MARSKYAIANAVDWLVNSGRLRQILSNAGIESDVTDEIVGTLGEKYTG
jgi:hypothetical protein